MSAAGSREPAAGLPARDRDEPARALETPARALETPARALETPARALETPARALDAPARRLSIKLCGVRRVADALLCADAGADELGVVFARSSKRCISIDTARALRESLPPALRLIGVFQDATLDELEAAATGAKLSALQLHGALPPGLFSPTMCLRLALPIHRALQITGPDSLSQLDRLTASATPAIGSTPAPSEPAQHVARVLLDGPRGGSGAAFPWALVREARVRFSGPLHLAGGLTPENVAEAIRAANPDGVDVSSGIEGSDGFKDPHKVRAFVRAAREAAGSISPSRANV